MKKTLFIICCMASLLAQSALAQITLSASPLSQNVTPGGTFEVTFSLSVSGPVPANVTGFDLVIETLAANSGFFAITAATPTGPFPAPSGPATYPESIDTASSNHAGFAQNLNSQGFVNGAGQTTPFSDLSVVRLTISIDLSTPLGTYDFQSTNTATSGARGSSVNDDQGTSFFVDNDAIFSITVVPEPAIWSFIALIALGGLVAFGANRLHLKRRV